LLLAFWLGILFAVNNPEAAQQFLQIFDWLFGFVNG
jgi:hypothetical protein